MSNRPPNRATTSQRRFNLLPWLLLILIAGFGAIWWRVDHKQKTQEAHERAAAEEKKIAEMAERERLKAREHAAAEERLVAEMADEARRLPATPAQQDLLSRGHPSLPWRQVDLDLPEERLVALTAKAQDLVLGKLKDPESAHFRAQKVMAVVDGRGRRYFFCGLVNAKNSFGGYTGETDYLFDSAAEEVDQLSGGIGDQGHIWTVKFDGRWWQYEADDLCPFRGTPIEAVRK